MSSSSFSLQPFHNAANIIVVRPPVKLAIDLPAFSRDHLVERVADYLCRVLHFCIGWLVSLDECPAASFHLTKISNVENMSGTAAASSMIGKGISAASNASSRRS